MKNQIVVDKSKLIMFEDCVCLCEETFKIVNDFCSSIDKIKQGDEFDCLLVDKNMLTMMWSVWNNERESFTITMTEPTVEVE